MDTASPEDGLLLRITLDGALAALPTPDRELIGLALECERPADYAGPWPPTLSDVGQYIGLKYKRKPLSEAAVRRRRDIIRAKLAAVLR